MQVHPASAVADELEAAGLRMEAFHTDSAGLFALVARLAALSRVSRPWI